MKSYRNDDLIRLLSDGQANLRMLALHLLSEAYASDGSIFDAVVSGWDQWGTQEAFPEYPMLSYFAIPDSATEDCCRRASIMVQNHKLTHPTTRCAGKLIEHMMRLPASALEPRLPLIESTVGKSKIFFRVDVEGLRERIRYVQMSSDELAGILNDAVASLCRQRDDGDAEHRGLRALEALRTEHPDFLDLANVLQKSPPAAGPEESSFQLTLRSLIQFEQTGLEQQLGQHLRDERESIYISVVEALVRLGNAQAAEAFVSQFEHSAHENQRWIARGLQRIRVSGLADRIAHLRNTVTDPALWLMLLIAEVRQFESAGSERISQELARLQSFSETLIDSLAVYARLNEQADGARAFQGAFMDYIQRSNESLGKMITESQSSHATEPTASSAKFWQQIIFRYRHND